MMSSTLLIIVGWCGVVYSALWMCLVTYHCYLYYLQRRNPFFATRLPNATLFLIVIMFYMVIQRMLGALISMNYLDDKYQWELTTVHEFTQFFIFLTILNYKQVYISLSIFSDFHSFFLCYFLNDILIILPRQNNI